MSVFKVGIMVGMVIFLLPLSGDADFPDKPIQVLVGWPAGSRNDMIDRAVAHSMQKTLKQPVITQNVPGGGGALVLGRIKTEKADGYTLFQTGSQMYARTPHLRAVPYDPLKDFAYLAQHAWFQYVIVDRVESPWKNFEEMISYVKKNPKKVRYSSSGIGSSDHTIMEYLKVRENLDWIHVPFTAGTEGVAALMGGHVEIYSGGIGPEADHVHAGRLRVLLSMGPKRVTLFPDVPSILEKGYDFSVISGACWTVPARTPKEIQLKLEGALLQSFKDPMVIEVINKWNMALEAIDGETLTKMTVQEYKINGELLKQFGLGICKK